MICKISYQHVVRSLSLSLQLIVLTPKSLLRHLEAKSSFDDMLPGEDWAPKDRRTFKTLGYFLCLYFSSCRHTFQASNPRQWPRSQQPGQGEESHFLHWQDLLWTEAGMQGQRLGWDHRYCPHRAGNPRVLVMNCNNCNNIVRMQNLFNYSHLELM